MPISYNAGAVSGNGKWRPAGRENPNPLIGARVKEGAEIHAAHLHSSQKLLRAGRVHDYSRVGRDFWKRHVAVCYSLGRMISQLRTRAHRATGPARRAILCLILVALPALPLAGCDLSVEPG